MTARYYEIRVAGNLPPDAAADFERLVADPEPAGTVLRGPLADQAALQRLLDRLELLGIQVLEVRRAHQPSPE